jgi:hypothetical protein
MTLDELLQEIDRLDDEALKQLQDYLTKKQQAERLKKFDQAVAALQADLTRKDVEAIKQAMSQDYVEPMDVEAWQD